jgi:exopolyphosphatase / guanosine-5'-triphosphate,3'-diphosphate pyrophosphatase
LKKRIAVIDLGTNTFHLLIVECIGDDQKILFKDRVAVKIGKGGINNSVITDDAMLRALNALKNFRKTIDEYKVDTICATATSAVRSAQNGNELVALIKKETGIEVQVISGDKEAELIYYGVKSALNLGDEKSLIVDIGGGSVEFIICDGKGIFWKQSFEIGAQRLLDLFHVHDPIRREDIVKLHAYLQEKLLPLRQACAQYKPTVLVGSSGSFDTISDIDAFSKGMTISIEQKKEYLLKVDSFERIYWDMIHKNKEQRLRIPGMIEMRVDMIVVAVYLIKFVMESYDIHKIRVSSYALKEGVLSKILKGELVV